MVHLQERAKVNTFGEVKVSVPGRTIKINGYISLSTVSTIARAIRDMQRRNVEPIVVILAKSYGGCASSGQMLFGILKNTTAPIYTVVERLAWSAAFYIFLAGEKRIMFKNAKTGPHSCTITNYKDMARDVSDIYRDLVYVNKFNGKIFASIRSVVKIPPNRIREMCLAKKVFSAREALKLGLATHIASGKKFYKTRIVKKSRKARIKVRKIGPK